MAFGLVDLYPPILDTYLPVFNNGLNKKCRVYFSLSPFLQLSKIRNVQMIIRSQRTNQSVLDPSRYTNDIKLCLMKEDSDKTEDNKYYVEFSPEDIVENNYIGFQLNEYYKIQLRFTSIEATSVQFTENSTKGIGTWLSNNLDFFSEWSTVCLVKGISEPILNLTGLSNNINDITIFNYPALVISGKLQFENGEKETLRSYNIHILDDATGEEVANSGEISTTYFADVNSIYYEFPQEFKNGFYKVNIDIVTRNLYQQSYSYSIKFDYNFKESEYLSARIKKDYENGCFILNLDAVIEINQNIQIKRTSSKSGYEKWETIYETGFIQQLKWTDRTIESGIFYKYKIYIKDSNGLISSAVTAVFEETENDTVITDSLGTNRIISKYEDKDKEFIMEFDSIFLTGQNTQIKIQYRPSISSYKTILNETKTDTIGSKYPYIRKNGAVEYRQYALSGLITVLMDENEVFISKANLLNPAAFAQYQNYYSIHQITDNNNYLLERLFREKVMQFLNDGQVKLLRTATEGNTLVRLMDINFTPETGLSNLIYNFSCTAYEIDNDTIENYGVYNIQDIKTSAILSKQKSLDIVNNLYKNSVTLAIDKNENIMSYILQSIQNSLALKNLSIKNVIDLNLNINEEVSKKIEISTGEYGYCLNIDDKVIKLINGITTYSIVDYNLAINQLSSQSDIVVTIDYEVELESFETPDQEIKATMYVENIENSDYAVIQQEFKNITKDKNIVADIISLIENEISQFNYFIRIEISIPNIDKKDNPCYKILIDNEIFMVGQTYNLIFGGINIESLIIPEDSDIYDLNIVAYYKKTTVGMGDEIL